jgi:hypothetical protein
MRKILAPISISQSRGHEQEKRSIHLLPKRSEGQSVAYRAAIWGLLVTAISISLHYGTTLLRWAWVSECLVESTIEGASFALLMWMILDAQEKRLRHRFKELGYLNHHIRNSLTTIQMADGYVTEAGQRSEMIADASRRIRLCVEKISREEDCEIDENSPEQP